MSEGIVSLGYLPHVVLGGYLVVLMVIGVMGYRRSAASEVDYYLAGRGQGWFVTAMTIMATFFSSGAMLGIPGQVYKHGAVWLLFALNVPLSGASIYLLGSRIARVGRAKGYITPGDMVSDYYGSGRALRLLVVLIGLLYAVPYVVMQIKAGGILAEKLFEGEGVFGVGTFTVGASALAVVTGLYIMAGGMRSVAWTDALQGLLLIGGMLVGGVAAVWSFGGLGACMDAIGRLPGRTLSTPGTTGEWPAWRMFTVCLYGSLGSMVQPAQWMRFYAAKSNSALRRSAMICAVVLSICFLCGAMLVAMAGSVLYPLADEAGEYRFAVMNDGVNEVVVSRDIDGMLEGGAKLLPNEAVGESASDFDQVTMVVLHEQLPAMLGGAGLVLISLFSVAVMAASMSTADSNLHALSALLTRDVYDRFVRPGASERERAWVGRGVIAVATLIALGLVLASEHSATFHPVEEIAALMIFAIAFSAQIVPVAIDMLYVRKGTRAGAIAGMVVGLGVVLGFSKFGEGVVGVTGLADTVKQLGGMMDAGMWGLMVNGVVFVGVSLVTKKVDKMRVDEFEALIESK